MLPLNKNLSLSLGGQWQVGFIHVISVDESMTEYKMTTNMILLKAGITYSI